MNELYEIKNLKYNLEDYLLRCAIDTHKNTMNCPICGDKDGFHFVPNTNKTMWKCFSAKHSSYEKSSGDIFDLVQQLSNVDFKKSCEILIDMYLHGGSSNAPKVKEVQSKDKPKEQKSHIKLYNMALQNQDRAIEYLKNRALIHAEELAKRFQIGYVPEYAYEFDNGKPSKVTPAVIIPMSDYSYSWRSTTENLKKKSGAIIPLNLGVLQDTSKKWIFLVEGEFDMLSILDVAGDVTNCEYSAICLSSAVNLEKFIDKFIADNINQDTGLIIALDNDKDPNINVTTALQKGVAKAMEHKIPCVVADVKEMYLNQKDSNDALKHNRDEFSKEVAKEVEKAKNLDISRYLEDCTKLLEDIKIKEITSKTKLYEWNYIGEIQRCFDICKDFLRYCKQSSNWYHWNGVRLEKDVTSTFITDIHNKIHKQCKYEKIVWKFKDKEQDTSYADDFDKEHKISISKKGLENALEGVSRHKDVAIKLLDLDNPKFLNCIDTTLNLETFTRNPHNIDDLCTKLAPVIYEEELNPECMQGWNNFISDIMLNDASMIEYLQRACGYILELYNREECFFMFYGSTTRNGKSTLLEAISNVLGDYAKAVSSATLSEKTTGKEANPEILALVGAKLITCGELNAETLLNDTLLKAVSGRDTISARLMYDNNVQNFQINGKIIANCNELPPMKNDDLLNSNRIIVIPFDRHFEEHEQNKDLKKIFSTAEYQTVILHWLINGYKNYKQYGLKNNVPVRVQQAIENYQSEANTINQFLNDDENFERIDPKDYSQAVKLSNTTLYERYKQWCKDNGAFPHSKANFKKHLKKHKCFIKDSFYQGIRHFSILSGYKLKPSIIFTDEKNSNNPHRLVAISQEELDK